MEKQIIESLLHEFVVNEILAETDSDAIGFYLRTGFEIVNKYIINDTERYLCRRNVVLQVINHYDKLIDQNNDPVHDPKPLKEYMDKWDGTEFINALQLNKTVLEIGVGSGRLAVKVAPNCGSFTGIDISPKTVERAKENLSVFRNVNIFAVIF